MTIGAADGKGFYLTTVTPQYDDQVTGDIRIEKLNNAGIATETYEWMQDVRGKEDGWYLDGEDLIGEDVDDIFIPAGEGMWVNGLDGAVLPFAGEVYTDDKSITLGDDKQMLSNPYPCDLHLARDISIVYDDQVTGDIRIEKLNKAGIATETYEWMQDVRGKEDGWYLDGEDLIGEDVDDIVFPSGTGLWVNGLAGAKFNITSPLK